MLKICRDFYNNDICIGTNTNDNNILNDILYNKIYLITTYWTYPFGGGEEFMYDTMEWANKLGMKPYWIAFSDSHNESFNEFEIKKHKNGSIIHIPGGFSVNVLKNWISIIKPNIVHHQGIYRDKFFMATDEMRIEFLSGFHLWIGGILLDKDRKNTDIIKNAQYHKVDPDFEFLKTKSRCNLYCASKFVQDCFKVITHTLIPDVIFPSASADRYSLLKDSTFNPYESKYVVMINIHKKKGGYVFYHLLKNCPDIHFLCVRTEHCSKKLDNMIKNEIEQRNAIQSNAGCIFMERTFDVKFIYSMAKIILCASDVDETFCRVVNEGMMNGIPVLTTHRGNIKYLVGESTPVLDPKNPDEWEREIRRIYNDKNAYTIMSNAMKNKYIESSDEVAKKQFETVVRKIIAKSKDFNVGIFTPWCDQGLGIQSKNYYNVLKDSNLFNISIFAIKPYNANSCIALQKNPNEWLIDNIYYSPNCREDVKDREILEFCRTHNIGKMIIPETCWVRIFQIAKLLREINVKAYAIPNIEIVRKNEIYKHNYFYKVLANNFLCQRILSVLDIPVSYIGYGVHNKNIGNHMIREKKFDDYETIKFLFIGGMNAFSRKQVLEVCEGFCVAYKTNSNIQLTITIQMTNLLEDKIKSQIDKYANHPGITILQSHLSCDDIQNLYYEHHISIQVSKHEGLGLGFYEAVATETPVLSLCTPPHNEIIINGVNGWLIECHYEKMTDNNDPLFESAYFNIDVFAKKIIEISSKANVLNIIKSLRQDNMNRLNLQTFSVRFVNELMD